MNTLNTYYCCDDLKRYLKCLSASQNFVYNTSKPIQNNQEELVLICEYHNNIYDIYSNLRLELFQNPIVILSFQKEHYICQNAHHSQIINSPASAFLRLPIDYSSLNQSIISLNILSKPELVKINSKILGDKILNLISQLKHNSSYDIINKFLFPLRIMAYNLLMGLISREKYETFIFTIKNNSSILALREIHKDLVVWEKYHYNSLNKSLFLSVSENISLLIKEIDFLITNPMNEENIKIIDKVIIVFQNLMKSIGK